MEMKTGNILLRHRSIQEQLIFTVVALVAPFIFISNVLMALGLMLIIALSIIALFNYYYSIARSESFRKRFTEMAVLSFSCTLNT